jgi:hypothetical protein
VFIIVVVFDFIIYSVRKFLDRPSYLGAVPAGICGVPKISMQLRFENREIRLRRVYEFFVIQSVGLKADP